MLLNLDRLEHRTAPTFSTAIGAYGTEANDAHLFAEDLCTLMATVTSGFASEPPFNVNGTRNLSYNDRLLDLEHYLETHFDYTDTRTERVASVQPSRVAKHILAFLNDMPPFNQHVWPVWPVLGSQGGFVFEMALTRI